MSSRKQPFVDSQRSQSTPTRYVPSTPHALRALQQRSGNQQRSIQTNKRLINVDLRPDSARGILRQLAKLTAATTKKRIAQSPYQSRNKENVPWHTDEDDLEALDSEKPRETFALDDTVEEDDSEIPVAPTPSVLPEDSTDYDDQPTISFQPIRDNEENETSNAVLNRRRLQLAIAAEQADDYEDGNTTIMTERGRRAMSEDMTGRLSRYSFGSIHMDEFGSEPEIRRDSAILQPTKYLDIDYDPGAPEDAPYPTYDDTEVPELLRSSPLQSHNYGEAPNISHIDESMFHLPTPEATQIERHELANKLTPEKQLSESAGVRAEANVKTAALTFSVNSIQNPQAIRKRTLLGSSNTITHSARNKRLKLTRHGNTVPNFPSNHIKRIALETQIKAGRRKPTLGRDHLQALEQATEWFFEQVGCDLEAYSSHGRRKKRVDDEDVLLLMKRQKMLNEKGQLHKLAKDWLPRDDVEELDLLDGL